MFVFLFQIRNENSFMLHSNNIGLYICCNNYPPRHHINTSHQPFRLECWIQRQYVLRNNRTDGNTLELLFSLFYRGSLLMLFLLLGQRKVWLLVGVSYILHNMKTKTVCSTKTLERLSTTTRYKAPRKNRHQIDLLICKHDQVTLHSHLVTVS